MYWVDFDEACAAVEEGAERAVYYGGSPYYGDWGIAFRDDDGDLICMDYVEFLAIDWGIQSESCAAWLRGLLGELEGVMRKYPMLPEKPRDPAYLP